LVRESRQAELRQKFLGQRKSASVRLAERTWARYAVRRTIEFAIARSHLIQQRRPTIWLGRGKFS
jgi:hypothetical protein